MLKNYMEISTEEVLKDLLKSHELKCSCERCIEDIKAIALNNLKPMYVVTEKGMLYSKIEDMNIQSKADVISALMMAIEKVEEKPNH